MAESRGKRITSWSVHVPEASKSASSAPATLWKTREEAIEGYCRLTGKRWEELARDGATLVEKTVIIFEDTE